MHILHYEPGVHGIIPESPSAKRARLELALIMGGTLGAFAVLALEVAGKRKLATALTGAGILAGGAISAWRVVEDEKYRAFVRTEQGLGCATCGGYHGV